MRKIGLILFVISGCFSQTMARADDKKILWRDVYVDQTEQSLKEAYPEKSGKVKYSKKYIKLIRVSITEKCLANVEIYHKKGVVSKIYLSGNGSLNGNYFSSGCAAAIESASAVKFGEPLRKTREEYILTPSLFTYWQKDGIDIRFYIPLGSNSYDEWGIIYQAAASSANI